MMENTINFTFNYRFKTLLSLLLLCLPATLLYSIFLKNPLVFDDLGYFDGKVHTQFLNIIYFFDIRWLPYASLEWTQYFAGKNMIWYRLGNLAIHLATTVTLFFFLRRLFEITLPAFINHQSKLSTHWLAFFGALMFSLHPVSVYAVGYLIQRSILMSTLFAILTWLLFLEGIVRENKSFLITSTLTYLLAILSKEHAIMVPAVAGMLLVIMKVNHVPTKVFFGLRSSQIPDTPKWLKLAWGTFMLYAFVGGWLVYQMKSRQIIGLAYEPLASSIMARQGIDTQLAYPLSAITQMSLFFKYLSLWLFPYPDAMAIDIRIPFSVHLWSWPKLVGLVSFIIYPFIALSLLFKKETLGLLGLALLCTWLLFATELSSVRIQEAFVLYRSYLWMPCLFIALPFFCQKLSAKITSYTLVTICILIFSFSWTNLVTFSQSLLLWDDAVMLAERNGGNQPGAERMYYNLANAYKRLKLDQAAIKYYQQAIKIGGDSSPLASQSYQGLARIYFYAENYAMAQYYFNKALACDPKNKDAIEGLADSLKALN